MWCNCMEVISLQEIPDSMLDSLVNNIQREWKMLSPAEDRAPFKDQIKNCLLHSHNVYYSYCVTYQNSVIGTFTLKEKDMTSFGIHTPEKTIWLMDLFVVDGYRGHGIGRAMVGEAIRLAREKGYKHVYIQCIKRLERFFEKHGFQNRYSMGAAYDMPFTVVMELDLL